MIVNILPIVKLKNFILQENWNFFVQFRQSYCFSLNSGSSISIAKEIQYYDQFGNPTSCEIDSNGRLEFIKGKCPSSNSIFGSNFGSYDDKIECKTDSGESIEILLQHFRITEVTVYAFGETYTGLITQSGPSIVPRKFSVKTNQAELYEPEKLVFYIGRFTKNPYESLPTHLTAHLSGRRAPWTFDIFCK